MKTIEITIKDLVVFVLLIGIIFFVTIKFIQYEAALNQVKLVNQVTVNTQNIQLLHSKQSHIVKELFPSSPEDKE